MKEIDRKDPPHVSGGLLSDDDPLFPPYYVDYPREPLGPFPEPPSGPTDPQPFVPVK